MSSTNLHPKPAQQPTQTLPQPWLRLPDTGLESSVKNGSGLPAIHHGRLTRPLVLKRPRLSLTPDTVIDGCP